MQMVYGTSDQANLCTINSPRRMGRCSLFCSGLHLLERRSAFFCAVVVVVVAVVAWQICSCLMSLGRLVDPGLVLLHVHRRAIHCDSMSGPSLP